MKKAPGSLGPFTLLPRRPRGEKHDYGHALVVAGSDGMPGAAILASRAALLSGAGLVTLASTRAVLAAAAGTAPDLLVLPLASCAGALRSSAAVRVLSYVSRRRVRVAAVGPGLSPAPPIGVLVRKLLAAPVPLVLDADALNVLRGQAGRLRTRTAPTVLTPHRGEFSRFFGRACPAVDSDRRRLAKKLARAYHIVLVLKGRRTVVTDGVRVYVNPTGNAGMAKGGTGDVLTGMIAAFIAQGLEPYRAAAWAVRLHGRAGDRLAAKTSQLSVTASGMLKELPAVFRHAS